MIQLLYLVKMYEGEIRAARMWLEQEGVVMKRVKRDLETGLATYEVWLPDGSIVGELEQRSKNPIPNPEYTYSTITLPSGAKMAFVYKVLERFHLVFPEK